jgi:hypothetical protein
MSIARKLSGLLASVAAVLLSTSVASADTITWVNGTHSAVEADFTTLMPPSFIVDAGATSDPVYGEIFEGGQTPGAGASSLITAYLGYGTIGSNPLTDTSWTWVAAIFDSQSGNNDRYKAQIVAPLLNGTYAYTYRFSVDGGLTFTAADLTGAGSNMGLTYEADKLGTMTVVNGLSVPDETSSFALMLIALAGMAVHRRRLLALR